MQFRGGNIPDCTRLEVARIHHQGIAFPMSARVSLRMCRVGAQAERVESKGKVQSGGP
jgi:hypothetical protein